MGLGGFEATMRKLTIGSIAALALIGLYFLALYVIFPIPGASLGELEEYAVGSGQEDLARLLAATDEITAAVKKHEGLALFSEPFEWADPREQSFRLPSELLQAIDNGNRRAYPLEVAALAAAMTRSRAGGRLHAKIVEVLEFEGLRSPDPSGRLGYYLIEIEGERHDVFGLGGGKEATRVRVLDDREALGAAIAVKAFIELTQDDEIGEGIRATRRARELDPKSPSIRAIEGTILISAGEIDDGERELQAALSLGADPARKNILAGFRMSMGDLRAADQIISEALREDPELAPAYVTRAAIDLSMEQPYAARRALERAETLDPTLPSLPILFAQLDLMEGRPTEALRRVREQIAAHPDDAQTHLAALPIFQATHRYSDLRRSVQAVLRLSPPEQREVLRQEIAAVFGSAALLPPIDDELEDSALKEDASSTRGRDSDDGDEETGPASLELRLDPSLGIPPPDFQLNPPSFD